MKVMYILDSFPNVSETFISDEIYSLIKTGIDCYVFSIKQGNITKIHLHAQSILDSGRVFLLHPKSIFFDLIDFLYLFIRNPLNCINKIRLVVKSKPTRWIARRALYISKVVVRQRITHIHAHYADQAAQLAMWTHQMDENSVQFYYP